MGAPFSRTDRALAADGHARSVWAIVGAIAMLGAWSAWMALSRIGVHAVTDRGRIEVAAAAHAVEVPVAGRVIAVHAELRQHVEAGDVLFELDREAETLELETTRVRHAALLRQIASIHEVIAAETEAIVETKTAGGKAVGEARARQREAAEAARIAEHEAAQAESLLSRGALSQLEKLRSESEALQRAQAAEASRIAANRARAEARKEQSDRRAQLQELRREVVDLQGQAEVIVARIEALRGAIDRGSIRSPISGEVGELGDARVGAFVEAGERLAAIVPPGELHIVGDFAAADAIGRIAPEQSAVMRLDGFPWTQYGTLAARVTTVATEAEDGRIRVELDIVPNPSSRIPIQHGLPGTIEVEVEKVSPMSLVLRAAGRLLTAGAADAG